MKIRNNVSLETLVIIYSIINIELTLAWNHVTGVYEVSSTGQVIPSLWDSEF
jgi:hypothetical protein